MIIHRPQLSLHLVATCAGSKRGPSKCTNAKSPALKRIVRLPLVSVLLWFSLINAVPCRGQSSGDNAAADTRNNADKVLRSAARVNPATLGVELTIPLGGFPGRGNAALVGALYYSSKAWRMDTGATTVASNTPGITIVTSVMPVFAEFSHSGWTDSLQPPRLEFADLRKYNSTQPGGGGCGGNCGGGGGGGYVCYDDGNMVCECASGGQGLGCHFIPLTGSANPDSSDTSSSTVDNGHQVIYRIVAHMPDGSTHELVKSTTPTNIPPGGTEHPEGTYYATDGSSFRLEYSSSGLTPLFLPDGSRYIFNFANFAQGGQAEPPIQYIDRNGNQLSYVSSSGAAPQWQDTMGRTLALPFTNNVPTVGDLAYSVPGVNGSSRTYILRWRQLSDVRTDPTQSLQYAAQNTNCDLESGTSLSPSLFASSCDGDNQPFNPVLLSEVVLPNGQSYRFTYNIYGEMDKVVYPTGGYERYRYDQVPGASGLPRLYRQGNRGVVERWVSARGDGTDEVHWQYSATRSAAGTTPLLLQVNILAPDGSSSARNVLASPVITDPLTLPSALTGRPFEERAYSATGQMLRRSLSDWTVQPRGPQLTKQVDILLDTGGNALAKTITYGYDQDLYRTSTNEYDYVSVDPTTAQTGASSTIPVGSLLRTAEATFLVNDPNIDLTTQAAYRGRNLLALPTSTRVKDAAGNIVAQSSITYDEASYPLLTYGSVTGWIDPGTNVRGNPTTVSHWLNTTNSYVQTHAQFDQCGSVRNSWDAKGNQSQVEYSSDYAYAYPTLTRTPVPDPTGQNGSTSAFITTTVFDFNTGLVTSTTDANGVTTTLEYNDALDRPTRTVRAYGTSVQNQTSISYDDTNRIITTTSDQSTYNDNVLKSQSVYDGLGRTIESRNYEGGTNYIAAQTQYDAMGRAYKVSNPFRQNETPAWTTSVFDVLGRVISVTTQDNAVITTSYSGNIVTVTDQAGKQRQSVTDGLGRLIQVYEDPAGLNYLTSYGYDALDDLITVNQDTQNRGFVYDSLKRLTSATNPESGTVCYGTVVNGQCQANGYDANGNLVYKTDARGVLTTYAYDALNRAITRTYSDGTPAVAYNYDSTTIANGKGRLAAVSSSVSSYSYSGYDALGRALGGMQTIGSQNYSISNIVYDLAGHITSMTYPSGRTVANAFDNAGRLNDFRGNLGGTPRIYSTGISYDAASHWTREQFGTNDIPLYNKRHYNIRQQLYDMRVSTVNDDFDWNRGNIANYYNFQNFGFGTSGSDNNGNLLIQQHWIPDGNGGYTVHQQNYDYDSLNRIKWMDEYLNGATPGTGGQSYSYDRWGNRSLSGAPGLNNTQFSIDPNTNRYGVPAGQSGTMTYDAAGNLTTDTYSAAAVTRAYDAENRMTSETQANGYIAGSYSYDGDGHRVKRNLGGTETWQVYGLGGELLAEYAQNGAPTNPQKEYGYRNGELLITAEAATASAPAPAGLSASASSASVALTWTAASGATSYRVERKGAGGAYGSIGTTTSTKFTDGAGSGNAYLYKVCAADGSGNCTSGYSNVVLGAAVSFTDPTIITFADNPLNATSIKAAHITELRSAVNAVRSLAGLSAASWTNATLTPQVTQISADDIRDLRARLDEALTALGIQTSAYTDPTLVSFAQDPLNATPVRAVHIRELRQRATNGVGGSGGSAGPSLQIHWLVTDQLGTPRMIFDQSGSLATVSRHDYLPFGEELGQGISGRTQQQGYSASDTVRQKFTSKERDNETGLDYFGARYSASTQGRFTSPDPLLSSGRPIHPQSWNRYSYVINQPLSLIDPDGLDWGVANWTDEDGVRHTLYQWFWDDIGDRDGHHFTALDFGGDATRTVTNSDGRTFVLSNDPANHLREVTPHPQDAQAPVLPPSGWDYVPVVGNARRFVFHFKTHNFEAALLDFELTSAELGTANVGASATAAKSFATGTGEAIFYSGGRAAFQAATEAAASEGGKTISMTLGGRVLQKVTAPLPERASTWVWNWGSKHFAEGASGNVRVFLREPIRSNSTWNTVEYPILRVNPFVRTVQR